MANVNITFNGKEFLLSCEDGQEEHLQELSIYLNEKFINLKSERGNIGENKLLLITSIKVMDEYFETKKKIKDKKKELTDLSNKFKELKSLVYEYKNIKEKEIKVLMDNQSNIKKEIENNKEDYEKIIEEAAEKIESFIHKINLDNQIQS
jgi:cell division protein ZapA